ncbi:MAG: MOSC domain-containing protein, partial [Tepidiformaceae bacterium]
MQHRGRIFQINVSNGGVPKLPIESAVVAQRGITTDRQADLRAHGSLDQALCIYAAELIGKLQDEGHRVYAGCLGENITTERVEWRLMTPGTRVRL